MQHPNHDLTLIAGLAAGDLTNEDRARAQATLDTCTECTALHADLIAIAAATRALPKLGRAPQDFRLSDVQAARLHRRSWLRALLAPFAGARSATRPMAAAFTSLGLVGLLVVTVLPGLFGSAASLAPQRDSVGAAAATTAAPVAAPAATDALGVPVRAAGQSGPPALVDPDAAVDKGATEDPGEGFVANLGSTSSGAPRALGEGTEDSAALRSTAASNPLLVGSLVILGIGLTLYGLRFAGRRLR